MVRRLGAETDTADTPCKKSAKPEMGDPYAEAVFEAMPANVQGGVFDPETYRYQVGARVQYLFKD